MSSGPTLLWYIARSTGYVTLLLLTMVMFIGITLAVRRKSAMLPGFLVQSVHRNLSLLSVVFLLIHVVTAVADPFAGLSAFNAVIPFSGSYRPIWLGLGVISMELVAALIATSLLRAKIPFKVWRLIHWAAYLSWPTALLHSLGTGSDARSPWSMLLVVFLIAFLAAGLVWRVASKKRVVTPKARVGTLAATALFSIGFLVFSFAGPLQPGWAKLAGTPSKLLGGSSGLATPSPTAAVQPLPAGLSDTVLGTATQSGASLKFLLHDAQQPSLIFILTVPEAGTGQLVVERGGLPICSTSALIAQRVAATCGSVSLVMTLYQTGGTGIQGTLQTQAVSQ